MTNADIARRRMANQHLAGALLRTPQDVVKRLVAVQSQDYLSARWGVGIRMQNATEAAFERAFDAGAILRTHVLRPTWHFVTPADIRWLLRLTAPRVQQSNAWVYRKIGLDAATLRRSLKVLARALEGTALTRHEIRDVLDKARIATDAEHRLAYVLMNAELEGLVCSGPRRGKQSTWALLDERAPSARELSRDDALRELARRYFTSRGPATVQDFAKWSGLTVADARSGLESVQRRLEHETIGGKTYWFAAPKDAGGRNGGAHLLSIFDEYVSAYKDRSALAGRKAGRLLASMGAALTNIVVVGGQVVGTWKRTIGREEVVVSLNLFERLTKSQTAAVTAAAERLGAFLGRSAVPRFRP